MLEKSKIEAMLNIQSVMPAGFLNQLFAPLDRVCTHNTDLVGARVHIVPIPLKLDGIRNGCVTREQQNIAKSFESSWLMSV